MGLLDSIQDRVKQKINTVKQTVKQTAKSVYNSVVSDNVKSVASNPLSKSTTLAHKQNISSTSIIPQSNQSQTIGDIIVTRNEQDTNKATIKKDVSTKKITKNDVAAKNVSILKKAKSINVSEQEIKEMLIKRGITDDIARNLSIEEQYNILTDIEQSLDYYIELTKKNLIASDVDTANIIDENAESTTTARKNGVITNTKDVKKYQYAAKMKIILGDDFNQLSTEEQVNRIEAARSVILQEYNADFNKEYEAASKTKKTRMLRHKAKLDAFVEKQMQMAYLSVTDDSAEESIRFRNGHDIADAKRVAIDMKINQSVIAAKMKHSWDMKMLEYFHSRGEMPTSQEYQNGVTVSTSRMALEDITQYEVDADAFKKAYYNGEINASFLTEEYITATTVGVGMGATINNNLTVDEKVAFLKTWDEHAQQYDDYDKVKEIYNLTLKQYMDKHPSAKQGIDDIKTQYKSKYGKAPDIPKTFKKSNEYINIQRLEISQVEELRNNNDEPVQRATSQQIQQALTTMSYEQVRKQFIKNSDKDFAEAIIHNPKLKGHKLHIVGYIKTLSPQDLNNISKGCNTDMFLFILRNISPDKAGQLYDLSKSDKCYATRILGEKIIEEGQKNAA